MTTTTNIKEILLLNMKNIVNFISVIYSKIIIFFGYKYDKSIIPYGLYCYEPDDEKSKSEYDKNSNEFVYYIKPCVYYKQISKNYNGCKYLGIITDDMVFDDQCKLCSENYDKNDKK